MIRETLKKAAGLFVEFEEDPNKVSTSGYDPLEDPSPAPAPAPKAKTIEQIVREQPGPNLDEIKVPEEVATPVPAPEATAPTEPVVRPDGTINFESIYSLAKLPTSPFTAEQILELFASLPADLPIDSKRATIKVTLGAMAKTLGVTTEQIVADASRKLAALAAYNESFTKQATDYCARAEIEIMTLEQQIADKKKAIEEAKAKQETMNEACVKESDRLDDVLEFFSMDVPPSKMA
ncbi:MAG: hypothetical protein BGO01_01905 [Armatimonadetes bacterium 55-13]|nr:hypothetical protein [Armatimonadota bacterium]OJU65689.1 MAG: hypothetical protein BGO01_01905 [Armatimonadetes bacterium 55-13]